MVFVEPDALDVIPGCCLVANVALIDPRSVLFGDSLVNHFKMFHVMARRCLMALCAINRPW